MGLFSFIGFSAPAILSLIPILGGILFYLYSRKSAAKRMEVGTTYLLKKLEKQVLSRRRSKPPLRFLFELILISLLLFALSGPYFDSAHDQVSVLLDNSFSMSAQIADGRDENRFQRAKDMLLERVSLIPEGTSFRLYVTSPKLIELGENFTRKELSETLEGLRWQFGEDHFQDSLTKVINQAGPSPVIAVTDYLIRERSNFASHDIFSVVTPTSFQIGGNVAIQSVFPPKSLESGEEEIRVRLESFSAKSLRSEVILSGVRKNLQEEELTRVETQLAARESITVTFRGDFTDFSGFRAEILPTAPYRSENLIREDDYMYQVRNGERGRVLYFGEKSISELGLSRASFPYEVIAGTKETALAASKDAQLNIFHNSGSIKKETLTRPSLFIGGYEVSDDDGEVVFAALETASLDDAPLVLFANEIHPVLRYVPLQNYHIAPYFAFKESRTEETLLRTALGANALTGERSGHRFVALGFEVFPFEGEKSLTSSLLLLNALKWLHESPLTWGGDAHSLDWQPKLSLASEGHLAYKGFFAAPESDPWREFDATVFGSNSSAQERKSELVLSESIEDNFFYLALFVLILLSVDFLQQSYFGFLGKSSA